MTQKHPYEDVEDLIIGADVSLSYFDQADVSIEDATVAALQSIAYSQAAIAKMMALKMSIIITP